MGGQTLEGLAAAAARREAQRIVHEAGEWLASFRWQLYVVLSFRWPVGPEAVHRAINQWVTAMRAEYPRSFAYVAADRGSELGRWNVHALVGGLFAGPPPPEPHRTLHLTRAQEVLKRFWQRGRVVTAAPHDARRGAPSYLAQYWHDPEVPGTIFGQPIRKSHHPRSRTK